MINLFPKPKKVDILSKKRIKINSINLGENLLSDEVTKDFTDYCKLQKGQENIIFKTD